MTLPANPIVLIPARMASTRLPNKPLADIHGAPMIVHVWRRAIEAKIGRVVVAAAETATRRRVKTDRSLSRSRTRSGGTSPRWCSP